MGILWPAPLISLRCITSGLGLQCCVSPAKAISASAIRAVVAFIVFCASNVKDRNSSRRLKRLVWQACATAGLGCAQSKCADEFGECKGRDEAVGGGAGVMREQGSGNGGDDMLPKP